MAMTAHKSCRLRKHDTKHRRMKAIEKQHAQQDDPNKSTT